jgi:hypothetical protein
VSKTKVFAGISSTTGLIVGSSGFGSIIYYNIDINRVAGG